MSVKICHASISENGDAGWNGAAKAGDQTGREVCVRDWYSKPWDLMLRYPDETVAKKAAANAQKLANSNLVGYDQSQRNTLYQHLKDCGWNVDKYIASKVKTETDCSGFMYACYCCLLPKMRSNSNAPTTSTMKSQYQGWGFKLYTGSSYTAKSDNLKIGDILVKSGSHTVMAISNGSAIKTEPTKTTTPKKDTTPSSNAKKVVASEKAAHQKDSLSGTYKTTAKLNVRDGAGTSKKVLTTIPAGTAVKNYGYYTVSGGVKWLYIQFEYNKVNYTGFASGVYLKKA